MLIQGRIRVPGDKSISHRAILIGGISEGITEIDGFLYADDCMHTARCYQELGVIIEERNRSLIVHGVGLRGLKEPQHVLDCGNSGTTMRLLAGVLAGQPFLATLSGDASLNKRPMERIVYPLCQMGAQIEGREDGRFPPLAIRGGNLDGITYQTPIPSAQVKSAILLAGLSGQESTIVSEKAISRDHTERMLMAFGADLSIAAKRVTLNPGNKLVGQKIMIPGDISSAAFFIAGAACQPGSHLFVEKVGLNPTRTGFLDVLQDMGASIAVEVLGESGGELFGNVEVQGQSLHGTTIEGSLIPRLIDEIPILAVVAAFAEGTTRIRDASELKVKESNRIHAMVQELTKLGVEISEMPDGMEITGLNKLQDATLESFGDHRVAMSLMIASVLAPAKIIVRGTECIDVSFPEFTQLLQEIVQR